MVKANTKADFEAKAQESLRTRVKLAGEIGAAIEQKRTLVEEQRLLEEKFHRDRVALSEKLDAQEGRIRSAYQAARKGGWSTAELAHLGIDTPPRRRRSVGKSEVAGGEQQGRPNQDQPDGSDVDQQHVPDASFAAAS